MEVHRAVAADLRISAEELEAEPAAPVTQAYTDFLIRTASTQDFAELAAALLPCMAGFSSLGQKLAEGERPSDPHLAAWIDAYASPEFGALADWCRDLVDRLGAEASEASRHRMEAAFLASSRHELAFWEMCWTCDDTGQARSS
jgi:thiaminase/transcriptional activator TenA